MKNSNEMADAVLRIRDEYEEKKRRLGRIVMGAALPVCLAGAVIAGAFVVMSDRQVIASDGISGSRAETAEVTLPVALHEDTAPFPHDIPEEQDVLIDKAEKQESRDGTKSTKKETAIRSAPVGGEEAFSETLIPETGDEAPAETAAEQMTATTTAVSFAEEIAVPDVPSGEVPADDMDGIPEAPETVNEAAVITAESLYKKYPTVYADREYTCAEAAVSPDKLGKVLVESEIGTFYSLGESGRIAVNFAGTELYIVYFAKEDQ